MVFAQKWKILTLVENGTIGKGISRGAEWCKFQLHSTFQRGVRGPQRMTSILVKMPDYSPWFSARNRESDFGKKKKDTIGKGIARGGECHKFELCSTFQRGVKGLQRMTSLIIILALYTAGSLHSADDCIQQWSWKSSQDFVWSREKSRHWQKGESKH